MTQLLTTQAPATETNLEIAQRLENLLVQNSSLNPAAVAELPACEGRFGLRTLFSRFLSHEFRSRLSKMAPWLITGGILGLELVLHAPTFVIGAAIASLTVRILKAIIKSNPLCQKLWMTLLKKAGLSEKKVPWLTIGLGGGTWLSAVLPSQAIFFDAAQNYVTTLFNTGGATNVAQLTPLIFGTLRIIFVLYIGIALVRVINAFRNDEDWGTAARIPLITVLCVVIGDALCNLIVPA